MAKLSSDGTYVTVESGDTLSKIASAHNTTVDALAKLNNIKNVNMITIGQKIKLSGTATPTKNNSNRPTILQFGLLSSSSTTLFASWEWSKSNTESYQIKWEYNTDWQPDRWVVGSSTPQSVNENDPNASKQCTYGIPDGAVSVRFTVKPVAKKKSSNSDTRYWTANWSTAKTYVVSDSPPTTPQNLNVEFKDDTRLLLLATLNDLDVNATVIQFQVLKRNGTKFEQFKLSNTAIRYSTDSDKVALKNGYARYSCYLDPGGEYQVRVRSRRGSLYSEWSAPSTSYFSAPSAPAKITSIRATSKTSVKLEWSKVEGAESYDIEYATELRYFDSSDAVQSAGSTTETHYEKTGLETGDEYFFRVRAAIGEAKSEWSKIASVILGTKPEAPTTWSSSTTVVTGEPLTFYWVHNSKDGSSQTWAELELTMGGIITPIRIENTKNEDEKDKTSFYTFDTSALTYGSEILWRVCTKGVWEGDDDRGIDYRGFSDWSDQRTVTIYGQPTLSLSAKGLDDDILSAFPLTATATSGPFTQTPITYHVSIVANESYDSIDMSGNTHRVNANEVVYSRHYDIDNRNLTIEISAGDVVLENNISYTLKCSVVMDSGLIAEDSVEFTTAWADDIYWPNAEVSIDKASYSASVQPYCRDEDENLSADHTLAVYRRNYDGSLVEIARDIPNDAATSVLDPHPALDYARYRIVAVSNSTGMVSFYDMPGVEVGGREIVLQWDEPWTYYDTPDVDMDAESNSTGSMLKLPYNIDVQESTNPDVSHVEYIGRQHPVSYYGTQLGETASWFTVIDKTDTETIYALRRLARWSGKTYVREPSGVGYWASVTVSMGQKHLDPTIPVSLSITRVEGGV